MDRLHGQLLSAVLLGFLSLSVGSNSQASTVSYSAGFDFYNTLLIDGGTVYGENSTNQLIHLPRFDPALGPLNSVTYKLTSALASQAFPTSKVELFLVGWAEGYGVTTSIAAGSFLLSVNDGISTDPAISGLFETDTTCERGSGVCTVSDYTHAGDSWNAMVTLAAEAGYQGPGNFAIDMTNFTTLSISTSNPGGVEAFYNTYWSGSLEVIYEYNVSPVPVPGALVLFASSLLGLLGVNSMRRTTSQG